MLVCQFYCCKFFLVVVFRNFTSLLACLLACLPACLPTCLPACLHVCLHACVLACLLACLLVCLLACWLAGWLAYFLPSFLPYLLTYLLTFYLLIYLLTYLYVLQVHVGSCLLSSCLVDVLSCVFKLVSLIPQVYFPLHAQSKWQIFGYTFDLLLHKILCKFSSDVKAFF